MEERNYYIYRHLKPCGEVFYIGLSKSKKRAKDKTGRNKYWKNLVKKHPDYEIQIITRGLNKEEACILEINLISWYGRRDLNTGTLVNLTSGGDGVVELSDETRKEMSRVSKERFKNKEEHHMYGRKGELNPLYGRPRTKEFKEHMSKLMKEKYANMENPRKGIPQPNRNIKRGGESHSARPTIDVETLETWGTVIETAKANNIEKSILQGYLSGRKPNRTNIVYLSDYVPGMKVKKGERIPHKKQVIDTVTGFIYNSCAEAARELEIRPAKLSEQLTGKKPNTTTLIFYTNV